MSCKKGNGPSTSDKRIIAEKKQKKEFNGEIVKRFGEECENADGTTKTFYQNKNHFLQCICPYGTGKLYTIRIVYAIG